MSNKSRLQTNNTNLQALIDKANALPDAGSSGGSNIISVTNNAHSSATFRYMDVNGQAAEASPGTTVNVLTNTIYIPMNYTFSIVSGNCIPMTCLGCTMIAITSQTAEVFISQSSGGS